MRFRPDHRLLIEDGRIVDEAARATAPGAESGSASTTGPARPARLHRHPMHSPQVEVIGGYGSELLTG